MPPTSLEQMKAPVHPSASFVASLLSEMSIRDQSWGFSLIRLILLSSACISFPIAFYFESFKICAYSIFAGTVLCALLVLPNWRRNQDEHEFVSDELVERYYKELEEMRKQTDSTSLAPVDVDSAPARDKREKPPTPTGSSKGGKKKNN
jgi:hypothetical protein